MVEICVWRFSRESCLDQQRGSEGIRKKYKEKSNQEAVVRKSCVELGPEGI